MEIDLIGRVNNTRLPVSRPLLPLLECVVNSIQAIEESGRSKGRIDVHVERDTSQGVLTGGDDSLHPVRSFTVRDNGVGFTDQNYRCFEIADSTLKLGRGNKGVGRFLWLKAFREARIESEFQSNGGWQRRTFDYRKTKDGIHDERVEPIKDDGTAMLPQTTVQLRDMLPEYQKTCPRGLDTIAERVLEHLLVFFVNDTCPTLVLFDQDGTSVNVNELFREAVKSDIVERRFKARNHDFRIQFLSLYTGRESKHRLFLCAQKREVINESIQSHLPDLSGKITDANNQPFVVQAYVSGDYLDRNFNPERTAFYFAEEEEGEDTAGTGAQGTIDFPDQLTKRVLLQGIVKEVKEFLSPFLEEIRTQKHKRIETFVKGTAPQYRPLLKQNYQDLLDRIPSTASDEKLDIELHRAMNTVELDLKTKTARIKNSKIETVEQQEKYKEEYERLLEQENEIGKSNLAKYVIHRRTILELFDQALKLKDDGKYSLEEAVHKTIFPLRATSDDIRPEQQNLWMIDERLSYHWYLASDRQLKKIAPVKGVESRLEPDLIIFNLPFAFTETHPPFQSIVIIEFKRPGRQDYGDGNPVEQVYTYIDEIAQGKATDKNGRPITVKQLPFYAYIICDLTTEIKRIAKQYSMIECPDGLGYFHFNQNYNCYTEIISFTKLFEDAKKRNRILFEKLGLATM